MRKKMKWMLGVGGVATAALLQAGSTQATPAAGFAGVPLAVGRFAEFEVSNYTFFPEGAGGHANPLWYSRQKTKGPSDLHVQSNVWSPGGTTGWHTHPGHSLIVVTEGTITAYEGDDPTCTPHVYETGDGFVDPGGDHVHVLRNEGSVPARTVADQLIPAGAARRVDAGPNPACPF